MHAGWLYRIRFIKRHLLMLLMAFGWLLIQSQVAIASHHCDLQVDEPRAAAQHISHMMMSDTTPRMDMMKSPLCEKHCVPDAAQKDSGHPPLVALPVSLALADVTPVCSPVFDEGGGINSARRRPAGNDPFLPVQGVDNC